MWSLKNFSICFITLQPFPSILSLYIFFLHFTAFFLNSPTDMVSDGNPPSSHFPSRTHTAITVITHSLPTAGSWWLLVNSVQYSPLQFNSHRSSNSTMALFRRGRVVAMEGGARRRAIVCVWVYVRLHALTSLYLWGLRTSTQSRSIHTHIKKPISTHIHTHRG